MSRYADNPPSRFGGTIIEWDEGEAPIPKIELIEDQSRSILSKNPDPSMGFEWSLNPYRGCTHACAYCYAREFHERLDLGAGVDFERVIAVKRDAPRLLEEALTRRSWAGGVVCMSGATDCYQAIERRLEITRACVAVLAEHQNPLLIITRSPLITRDLDLLTQLAAVGAAQVTISLPIVDAERARALEPGAPPPAARLRAIRALADAGVPVGVSLAPLLPGVNDELLPLALQAAWDAGARWAWTGLARLTAPVAAVYEERLRERLPLRAEAALQRLRAAKDGGEAHKLTMRVFQLWTRRLGYGPPPPWPSPSPFRRPARGAQLGLFGLG